MLCDVNDKVLFDGMTSEQLVVRFELDGVGQQSHWVQQSSRNCCSFSLKPYEGGAPCGNVKGCLYCRASQISTEDADFGTITELSAAQLNLFAHRKAWGEFETNSIFEFIMELNRRLEGLPLLKKELSYYGAIRNNAQELDDAVQASQLLSYHVSMTNNRKGVPYFRMAMDPTNQVYASWLVTISGSKRGELWSNNRERLGDVVEKALGLIGLTDDFVDGLGWLIGDPNATINRIE